MSSEGTGETVTVQTEGAAGAGTTPAADRAKGPSWCSVGDQHAKREDMRKVWKECNDESFWYRALPISVGSMAVTGGLIYNGVWKPSPRFGPFPKVIVAGILGYVVGKVSYGKTCRKKFSELGLYPDPESLRCELWGPRPGYRLCGHVCEECKKNEAPAAEQLQS